VLLLDIYYIVPNWTSMTKLLSSVDPERWMKG